METFLANLFLIIASIALTLGNFWFTYGLWPQSWLSFCGFGMGMVLLLATRLSMERK